MRARARSIPSCWARPSPACAPLAEAVREGGSAGQPQPRFTSPDPRASVPRSPAYHARSMPELSPFAGICYSATEELKDLVCPPYDVISPEEQLRLHRRHPHNAVRIELPFSERPDEPTEARYRRAGAQFRDWLREGVLVQ